jgi:hypothetical protein
MPTVLIVTLLVASVAGFAILWFKLRQVGQRLDRSAKSLAEIERLVLADCVPALAESSRRVTTVIERLDAERAASQSEGVRAQEGLGKLLEELAKVSQQLGEARVELARAIERAGQKPVEDARLADGPWLRELVRTHLIGLGIGSVTLDGVVPKPDGSQVVRARGLRGDELWTGNVVVRGGKVESASALAVRMFP